MSASGTSVALTAAWAALHTLQYGFGISAFNGIQDAVICPATKGARGGSWVTPCIPLTVSFSYSLIRLVDGQPR